MSEDRQTTDCDTHGPSPMAMVCQHILRTEDHQTVGFYEATVDLDDPDMEPQAWCQACDDKLIKAGHEWNELLAKHAAFSVVCLSCYEEYKDKQLSIDPANMNITYVPDNPSTEAFFDMADALINVANEHRGSIEDKCESFSFAAARYAAFEAKAHAKDVQADKAEIIDYFVERFKEMFVDNLNDYIENHGENQGENHGDDVKKQ